jgi:hypothetical protein
MVNLVEFKTDIWFIFTVDKGNYKNSANKEGCIAACQQIHPWLKSPAE